ncbi:hypothetical protein P5673_014776 [Acropora cervicornis]|uniref:Uncharacterized protein n=1 Tax=Acropora cervicornis TaxID=6130 RepID=A0AAD9V5P6_ACRCE|nr:hypothetical protein P5673_014776 [Acropora cervicornis]
MRKSWNFRVRRERFPEQNGAVSEPDEGDYYESIPHGVAGVPSAQSWTDLHPPSLLSAEPMDSSPRDMELQRREALQKKLAEKAERNKRKRPKINL